MNKIFNINFSRKDWVVTGIVILFYTVGALGFSFDFSHTLFTKLTPFVLISSAVLLFYYHKTPFDLKSILFFVFVFVLSFVIEVFGVKTGKLFGEYFYGSGLGMKIFDTPLLIGLNWALLVYLTSAFFDGKHRNFITEVVFTSALMVVYDVVLEPSASKMDMWFWSQNKIPLQNFIMWGMIALFFQALKFLLKIEIKNKMALPLLLIQMLFFFVISII